MQSMRFPTQSAPRGVVARPSVVAHAQPNRIADASMLAVATLSIAAPALAVDAPVDMDSLMAVGAVVGVLGLGGVLLATDPQKRRNDMAESAGGDEMSSVKQYFDTTGALPRSLVTTVNVRTRDDTQQGSSFGMIHANQPRTRNEAS